VAVELVCPPVSTTPLGKDLPPGLGARLGPALQRQIDAARWVEVEEHGYAVVDVGHDVLTATFWFVDTTSDDPPVRGSAWTTLAADPGRWHAVDPASGVDVAEVRRPWRPIRSLVGWYRRRRSTSGS
jgi:hypothetical protein